MNKTQIELKNVVFFAHHGVLPAEAELGQRFVVDALLLLQDGLKLEKDTPEHTVNYVEVFKVIKAIVQERRFNLIERLAEAVANEILQHFDRVMEVTVKVKKPSVPVDCICDYFAAEVTRCR